MQTVLALVILPLVFAFLYRCRGGAFSFYGEGRGTFSARLVWWAIPNGLAMAVLALVAGAGLFSAICVGIAAGILAYVGLLIPHGWAQNRGLQDHIFMAIIALVRSFLIYSPLAFAVGMTAFVGVPFAALAGVGYWVGYEHPPRWVITGILFAKVIDIFRLPQRWKQDVFGRGATEWGELITGFSFGLGVAICSTMI